MKRTEKSKANSRQKSRANGRQSKPKDYDRDKAKYEEKHSTEESCSQRCRNPAGARRSDHDCPKDRLRRRNRRIQENHPDSSEAEIVKIPQIRDREHRDGFFQSKSRGSMKSPQHEQKIFTTAKEDLQQNTTDILVVMQRQVLVIHKGTENGRCPTASVQ